MTIYVFVKNISQYEVFWTQDFEQNIFSDANFCINSSLGINFIYENENKWNSLISFNYSIEVVHKIRETKLYLLKKQNFK